MQDCPTPAYLDVICIVGRVVGCICGFLCGLLSCIGVVVGGIVGRFLRPVWGLQIGHAGLPFLRKVRRCLACRDAFTVDIGEETRSRP